MEIALFFLGIIGLIIWYTILDFPLLKRPNSVNEFVFEFFIVGAAFLISALVAQMSKMFFELSSFSSEVVFWSIQLLLLPVFTKVLGNFRGEE